MSTTNRLATLAVALLLSGPSAADGIINGGSGGGAPSGAAGGGLTGTYPNPTVATVPASALPLTNATLQGSVASTTATVSASLVMMGMGTTCKITPVYSGRVNLTFSGVFAAAAAVASALSVRYGTGTAPTNGAAITGSAAGSTQNAVPTSTQTTVPYSKTAVITGLTPGTAYWFDVALNSNNAVSVAINNNDCSAFEF